MLGYPLVLHQDIGVALFNDGVVFVLHVHVLARVGIAGRHQQAVQYGAHVVVVAVGAVVVVQEVLAVWRVKRLVEDAQHLVEAVVYLPVQTRYLHDDAVMGQALDERVGQALGHRVAVIVVGIVAHIEHRLLYVTHLVPQDIDGHHGKGIPLTAVGDDVLLALVLHAQVLAEAQGLRLQPGLLHLYQDEALAAVGLAHRGTEVDAEHRQGIALAVAVFVGAHLGLHDVLLQQGRQDGAGHTLVLHHELENGVVNGVGYCHHNTQK